MSIVVGDIRKNSDVRVRVTAKSYSDREFLDIRVHFLSRSGQWVPTRRGVTIDPNKIEELQKLLQEGKTKLDEGKKQKYAMNQPVVLSKDES